MFSYKVDFFKILKNVFLVVIQFTKQALYNNTVSAFLWFDLHEEFPQTVEIITLQIMIYFLNKIL